LLQVIELLLQLLLVLAPKLGRLGFAARLQRSSALLKQHRIISSHVRTILSVCVGGSREVLQACRGCSRYSQNLKWQKWVPRVCGARLRYPGVHKSTSTDKSRTMHWLVGSSLQCVAAGTLWRRAF
jgi:hypothetical protein